MNVEFRWWKVLLILTAFFGMGGLLLGSNWIATRGVDVVQNVCAWNETRSAYVATLTVRNRGPVFRLVSFHVQGHFRPGRNQQWPHETIRRQYEDVSQMSSLLLTPGATTDDQVLFNIPGGNRYVCRVAAKVSQQAQFKERPGADVVKAITKQFGVEAEESRVPW